MVSAGSKRRSERSSRSRHVLGALPIIHKKLYHPCFKSPLEISKLRLPLCRQLIRKDKILIRPQGGGNEEHSIIRDTELIIKMILRCNNFPQGRLGVA